MERFRTRKKGKIKERLWTHYPAFVLHDVVCSIRKATTERTIKTPWSEIDRNQSQTQKTGTFSTTSTKTKTRAVRLVHFERRFRPQGLPQNSLHFVYISRISSPIHPSIYPSIDPPSSSWTRPPSSSNFSNHHNIHKVLFSPLLYSPLTSPKPPP